MNLIMDIKMVIKLSIINKLDKYGIIKRQQQMKL